MHHHRDGTECIFSSGTDPPDSQILEANHEEVAVDEVDAVCDVEDRLQYV